MLINEITQIMEDASGYVVFYGGRFQPMHQGHRDVYKHLVEKFGAENVYIATTFSKKAQQAHTKGDYSSDPFTFEEKRDIMSRMFGIPADKIVNSNPYRSEPSVVGRNNDTDATILVYGAKDPMRVSGDKVKPVPDNMEGMTPHSEGIVFAYEAPLMQGGMSASDFRATMAGGADEEQQKQAFQKFFGKFDQSVFDFIKGRLTS